MTGRIENMFNAPDDEARREAALYLKAHAGSIETGRAVKMLARALGDSSWRVRKTSVDILVESYPMEAYLDSVVSLLYEADNAGARNSAIEVFVRVGPPSADKLFEAFRTDDAVVRKFIIDIAGEISHSKMLPLLTLALKDEDENVKASAVEHLGSMPEPMVVDSLISILIEGGHWISYPAIEALGKTRDMKAMPYLVDALRDKILIVPALKALGSMGREEAVMHIVPYLANGPRAVRQAALSSLESLYDSGVSAEAIRAEMQRLHGDKAVELILDAAGAANEELRIPALILLGAMGEPRAVSPLLQAAAHGLSEEAAVRSLANIAQNNPQAILENVVLAGNDPVMMRVLAYSMVKHAKPEFRDALINMLCDGDGHVRATAATGLGNLGDESIVPLLLEALYDRYEDVRISVVSALVKLKAGLVPGALEAIVRDRDPEIRKLAVPLLAAIGTEEALSVIALMLKDASHLVRKASVDYFANNLNDNKDSMLLPAMTDESPDVRSVVAIRLGETGNPEYLKSLVLLLSDNEDMVRISACKALGLLGSREALEPLSALLSDENGFVVASSMESISRIGGADAVEAIAGMLSSSDNEIRRTAVRSLSAFESAYESIIPYLESDDWATRYEAVKALARFVNRKGVLDHLRKQYDRENDKVVREALRELLNV